MKHDDEMSLVVVSTANESLNFVFKLGLNHKSACMHPDWYRLRDANLSGYIS